MKRGATTTLAVMAVALGVALLIHSRLEQWVAQTDLPSVLSEVGAEVRAHDGTLLRAFAVENGRMRLGVKLQQVDPQFIAMLIAYEDKRFFDHKGIDLRAMVRAAGQAVWHGEIVSGASTLTMQVARLLENSGTGSRAGKLRQIRVALALEQRLSKEDILTLYLHHAPYGSSIEGVRAVSHAWFGKEPLRLTQAQAALLIALPQSPEARRSDRHPQEARAARVRVLARLDLPPDLNQSDVPRAIHPLPQHAPHLAAVLRRESPAQLRRDTTLHVQLQRKIEALARRAVAGQADGVSAAILVADHKSGEIIAHVGSPAFTGAEGAPGFVDMTTALRSPGSTLKPLVYGLAFDEGLVHPDTLINDAPIAFGSYAPQNFDGQFRGMLTVRDALTLSLNIPPVLLTHELGAARLMSGLRRAGTQPQLPSGEAGLAVALGGVGMSLTDLVQLYAGIAQGGRGVPLHVQKQGDGAPLKRFMSPVVAWQVGHILSVIAPPQGSADAVGQIAYKTGTSYGHRDAWAIGFDGQHVVCVWLGRPDGTPVPGAFGGALAAPILFEAFGRIGALRVPLPPPPTDALILGTAYLPQQLRTFQSRNSAFVADPNSPVVAFPPDGAVLRNSGFGVPLKLRQGVLPLTILVDGFPIMTELRGRDVVLPLEQAGFTRISVVDARGRSDSVEIRLD